MSNQKPVAGKNGNRYVPFEERTGESSVVFFTRDLSEEGLKKIYDRVSSVLSGKIAIKLHTGEAEGPNILPRPWVKELVASRLPEATIVETNTYYEGTRYTTESHRKTLETNGWTFCPVDITDSEGTTTLPVKGGKWFTEMHVGKTLPTYDSLLVLTLHFFSKRQIPVQRNQMFTAAILFACTDVILEVFSALVVNNSASVPPVLGYVVLTIFYLMRLSFPLLMIFHSISVTQSLKRRNLMSIVLMSIPTLIVGAIILLTPLTHHFIYYENEPRKVLFRREDSAWWRASRSWRSEVSWPRQRGRA